MTSMASYYKLGWCFWLTNILKADILESYSSSILFLDRQFPTGFECLNFFVKQYLRDYKICVKYPLKEHFFDNGSIRKMVDLYTMCFCIFLYIFCYYISLCVND